MSVVASFEPLRRRGVAAHDRITECVVPEFRRHARTQTVAEGKGSERDAARSARARTRRAGDARVPRCLREQCIEFLSLPDTRVEAGDSVERTLLATGVGAVVGSDHSIAVHEILL